MATVERGARQSLVSLVGGGGEREQAFLHVRCAFRDAIGDFGTQAPGATEILAGEIGEL